MPRIVVDPKGRYSWEANFNPVLRMSHNAISTVKFKMDVERARYEKTLKRLRDDQKVELRDVQRETVVLREELLQLKAYATVAKRMAFEKFDTVLQRRRHDVGREDQAEVKVGPIIQVPAVEKQGPDSCDDDVPATRHGLGVSDMALLSSNPDLLARGQGQDVDPELARIEQQHRRLSNAGSVFVTFQDIMDHDSVLKMHSQVITEQRRKSQQGLLADSLSPSRESTNSKIDTWVKRRRARNNLAKLGQIEASTRATTSTDNEDSDADGDDAGVSDIPRLRLHDPPRRRSRTGEVGELAHDAIQENEATATTVNGDEEDTKNLALGLDGTQERKNSSDAQTCVKSVFITENSFSNAGGSEDMESARSLRKSDRDKPLTTHQIKRLYQKEQKEGMRNVAEEIKKQKEKEQLEQRRMSAFSRLLKPSARLRSVLLSAESALPGKPSEDAVSKEGAKAEGCETASPQPNPPEPAADVKPADRALKGLARFRDAARAVTIQERAAKKEGVDRFKSLAAAVIIQKSATEGRVPRSFLMSQFVSSSGEDGTSGSSPLEGVQLKMKPLAMPTSVRREQEKKWSELMINVNRAVHWKVRALREDTGTMTSRQLRRQERKTPREPRPLFPSTCKTTWAMKKFVRDEIADVRMSSNPENQRRKKTQTLIERATLPDFIDRVKTTNAILRGFREYKRNQEIKDLDKIHETGIRTSTHEHTSLLEPSVAPPMDH